MDDLRPVPGYESFYSVGVCGCVYSHRAQRLIKWFYRKPNPSKYAHVYLSREGQRKFWLVHRLVMATYRGPSKMTVNHKDFNTLNNHLNNLEYLTVAENRLHSIKAGRHLIRKRQFTKAEIDYIRTSKLPPEILALEFDSQVSRIKLLK